MENQTFEISDVGHEWPTWEDLRIVEEACDKWLARRGMTTFKFNKTGGDK